MITRIVRLTIQPGKVDEFKKLFAQSFPYISTFKGCTHLSLYHEYNEKNILLTFSKWNSAEELEQYRRSELFKTIWGNVKPLFAAAPLAFSMKEETF